MPNQRPSPSKKEARGAPAGSTISIHNHLRLFLSARRPVEHLALPRKHQKSNRSANCTSRGVPEPTGVIGETMLVFRLIVLVIWLNVVPA